MEERRQKVNSCDRGRKAIWDEKNTKFQKCVRVTILDWKGKYITDKKEIKQVDKTENSRVWHNLE